VASAEQDAKLKENIGPLQHPSDLDLLLFFHRFPRVLRTSEKLAEYIGYDVKQVGTSLERLIHPGLSLVPKIRLMKPDCMFLPAIERSPGWRKCYLPHRHNRAAAD
jgi:hypothetical protein